jgi:predicted glycogen debranching enzyme
MFHSLPPPDTEWLEADDFGSFASGTVSGIRTRPDQALLLTGTPAPAGRMALVNGFDAWVETPRGTFAFSSRRSVPEVPHPDGIARLESFAHQPWPRWTWRLSDDLAIKQEVFMVHGKSAVFVAWKLIGEWHGSVTLKARPFLSIRDLHGTQHENGAFRVEPGESLEDVVWQPRDGAPGVVECSNGHYRHEPTWYRNFLYSKEAARGFDAAEDLASPGLFDWDLAAKPAVWLFAPEGQRLNSLESTEELYVMTRRTELARREAFESPQHRIN